MDKYQPIFDALDAGGRIVYGPISGALFIEDLEGQISKTPITIGDFLALRKEGRIDYKCSMNQGHHIMHGRVDFYGKGK